MAVIKKTPLIFCNLNKTYFSNVYIFKVIRLNSKTVSRMTQTSKISKSLHSETKQKTDVQRPVADFDTIYKKYANLLFTYLLHQTPNREVAEDLFQEVMMKIFNNLDLYKPTASLKTWLVVIARNHLLDYYRRQNRWKMIFSFKEVGSENSNHHEPENIIPFEHPPTVIEDNESAAQLARAIKDLPEEQREVIHLHYTMQMSFREISEAIDCPLYTVASRARYALQKLRMNLEYK